MKASDAAISSDVLRAVFDHVNDGILATRVDTLEFVAVNQRMADMLGRSREEFLSLKVPDIHPPEELEAVLFTLRTQLASEPGAARAESVPLKRKDGRVFYADVHSTPIDLPIGPCLVGVFRDASERRRQDQAEERDQEVERRAVGQLRQSEARLRTLYEAMSEGLALHEVVHNEAGQPVDYRILDINPAYEAITGLPRQKAVGSLASKLYGAGEPPYLDEFSRVAETGRPLNFETYFAPMEKHFVISAFQPAPGQFATVFFDVSAQRKTEEVLKRSEDRYRNLVDNIDLGVLLLDRHYRVQTANRAFCRLFRQDRDSILEKPCHATICHADSACARCPGRDAMATRRTVIRETSLSRPNGNAVPIRLRAIPVMESDAEVGGFVLVTEDLTERRHLEMQLLQSQKMESIGLLAGGIAHDFNNLIQGILGCTELAMDETERDTRLDTYLQQSRRAALRAADLTRQILAFSRQQIMCPQDSDLNDIIAHAMKMIGTLIGENIELDLIPGHRMGTIHVDRGQMEQVLTNLCINARDAMPEGGKLTIETANVCIDDEYCISHPWARPGRYALMSITDTGHGMDAVTLERAFEPFFTTKSESKGTGLGLSTVYGIIRQHAGLIHAYSEVGKGAMFKIYIPEVDRPAVDVGHKIAGPTPTGHETILLAEDDAAVLFPAKTFLENAGYRVHTARDGEEALTVFEAYAADIDLAILDVVMPKLGGRKLEKRLRQLKSDLAVLFTSGYTTNNIHTNFVLQSDVLFLQKPYSKSDLLTQVRQALDRQAQSAP
jgi:two-component system cell cycle sensor histidine kinase/response regulator CckA